MKFQNSKLARIIIVNSKINIAEIASSRKISFGLRIFYYFSELNMLNSTHEFDLRYCQKAK